MASARVAPFVACGFLFSAARGAVMRVLRPSAVTGKMIGTNGGVCGGRGGSTHLHGEALIPGESKSKSRLTRLP